MWYDFFLKSTTPCGVVFTFMKYQNVSLWLRKIIEKLPFKQLLGVNLAGLAFVAAVVVPQATDIANNWEILSETEADGDWEGD